MMQQSKCRSMSLPVVSHLIVVALATVTIGCGAESGTKPQRSGQQTPTGDGQAIAMDQWGQRLQAADIKEPAELEELGTDDLLASGFWQAEFLQPYFAPGGSVAKGLALTCQQSGRRQYRPMVATPQGVRYDLEEALTLCPDDPASGEQTLKSLSTVVVICTKGRIKASLLQGADFEASTEGSAWRDAFANCEQVRYQTSRDAELKTDLLLIKTQSFVDEVVDWQDETKFSYQFQKVINHQLSALSPGQKAATSAFYATFAGTDLKGDLAAESPWFTAGTMKLKVNKWQGEAKFQPDEGPRYKLSNGAQNVGGVASQSHLNTAASD